MRTNVSGTDIWESIVEGLKTVPASFGSAIGLTASLGPVGAGIGAAIAAVRFGVTFAQHLLTEPEKEAQPTVAQVVSHGTRTLDAVAKISAMTPDAPESKKYLDYLNLISQGYSSRSAQHALGMNNFQSTMDAGMIQGGANRASSKLGVHPNFANFIGNDAVRYLSGQLSGATSTGSGYTQSYLSALNHSLISSSY